MIFFHPSRRRIDRYLAQGLSSGAEARLRAHLAGCTDCRGYYDQGVLLLRAVRSQPSGAGAGEVERILGRATAGFGATRRSWRPVGIFVGALATAAMVFIALRVAAPTPPARIASVSGDVWVGDRQASLDAEVPSDTAVEVRSGECILALEGGRTALLRSGTVVSIAEGGAVVRLDRGRGRFSVTPGKGAFSVKAGDTQVRVTGTVFAVERRKNDETLVAVHHGSVEVSTSSGAASKLTDGEETTVVAGRAGTVRPASREALFEDRGGTDLLKVLKKRGTRVIKNWEKAFDP